MNKFQEIDNTCYKSSLHYFMDRENYLKAILDSEIKIGFIFKKSYFITFKNIF